MVSDIISGDEQVWNLDPVKHLIKLEDENLIRAIPLLNQNEPDRLIWPCSLDGSLTVNSCYRWATSTWQPRVDNLGHSSHQVDKKL